MTELSAEALKCTSRERMHAYINCILLTPGENDPSLAAALTTTIRGRNKV